MVKVVERPLGKTQRLDRVLEKQVLEVTLKAGIPVEKTLAEIKGSSPLRVVNTAKKVLSSAVLADVSRRDGHSTLERTTELLNVARDKELAVAALWEMSKKGPESFGSRVEDFHRSYTWLRSAEILGGDDALQRFRKRTRWRPTDMRLLEDR